MPIDVAVLLNAGFNALAAKLGEGLAEKGFDIFSKSPKYVGGIRYNDHLNATFKKCSKTKTLVNPDVPVELMSVYVGGTFEQQPSELAARHSPQLDDFAQVECIWKNRLNIILGSAGSGKTFFTKYFWLSCFVRCQGKIPLYLELRKINDLSKEDLLSYVYHSIALQVERDGNESVFRDDVKAGKFVFIFDGFDEVKEEKRKWLEREILDLSRASDENIILVTSRPDERFYAWEAFNCYRALPMTKKQALELISKIEFDSSVKRKFISRVKTDLFEKHHSFLSSPLLATMMLLTFGAFADVPDKIHVFYEQAFDTLYARHDALKESFSREFHSGLKIDELKQQFAHFCLLTYDAEAYEFSETRLLEFLRETKKTSGGKFEEHLLLKDLFESVCMFQKEGLSFVFSHRSFQEFFTSYAMLRLDRIEAVGILVGRYVARASDNVVGILFDMNKDLVLEAFLRPLFDKYKSNLEDLKTNFTIEKFCHHFSTTAEILGGRRSKPNSKAGLALPFYDIIFDSSDFTKLARFVRLTGKLEPHAAIKKHFGSASYSESQIIFNASSNIYIQMPSFFDQNRDTGKVVFNKKWLLGPAEQKYVNEFFEKAGFEGYFSWLVGVIKIVCEELIDENKSRQINLASLLNLKN